MLCFSGKPCSLLVAGRPGDELLAVAGSPYDTLEEVIGLRGTPGIGSLMDFGVSYRKLELQQSGEIDWEALACAVRPGEAAGGGKRLSRRAVRRAAQPPSSAGWVLVGCMHRKQQVGCNPHNCLWPAAETKVALVQRSCGYALRPTLR